MPVDHYVSRFYLANFARERDGRRKAALWVYDKDSPEPRLQTPENTAAQTDFNTFRMPGGVESRALESYFSDLESRAKPIVDRWLEKGARPGDEIQAFVPYLAFAHTRVPRLIEAAKESAVITAEELVRSMRQSPDDIAAMIASVKAETGEDLGTVEEVQDTLSAFPTRVRITANEKEAQKLALRHTEDVIHFFLYTFNWCLCRAPQGSFFITSDTPVCMFVRVDRDKAIFGSGFGRWGAQITFPLSPEVCLLLDRQRKVRRMAVSVAMVREFNWRMAYHAERFVISPYRTKEVAAMVEKARETRQMPKLERDEFTAELRRAPMWPKRSQK
jgi:hypothetical protein